MPRRRSRKTCLASSPSGQVKVGITADVWSLGVVTWDCFSGKPDQPLFWPDPKISIFRDVHTSTFNLRRRAREQLKKVDLDEFPTAQAIIMHCLCFHDERFSVLQVAQFAKNKGWPTVQKSRE